MNYPDSQNLPAGHKSISNGNVDNCPYFQINKKIDDKFGETLPKPPLKPSNKNDSESDLSDDEGQGTQGACPFMPSLMKRNPDLNHLEEGYE